MSLTGSVIVFILTVVMVILSVAALFSRSLVRATYFAVGLTSCLTIIYIIYGAFVGNSYMYLWAFIFAVTRIWLLPFFKGGLLYSAQRMPEDSQKSPIAGMTLMVLVTLALLIIVGLKSSFGFIPGERPISHLGDRVSLNLIGAALLALYGIIALMTHRHPFKMVLGVMFMEMGIQMILVHLVPGLLAMVQIGILSNFVGSIFVILYVNRLIVERLKVTDTTELSELKY